MTNDIKDPAKEYENALTGLRNSLELMRASGINELYCTLDAAPKEATLRASSALDDLQKEALSCTACALGTPSALRAPGSGNPKARVVFVRGVADKDSAVEPFAGEEGKQLLKIIQWMAKESGAALTSDKNAYVCFAVKCAARGELPVESVKKCSALLKKELSAISPAIAVLLGPVAASAMLGSADIKSLRGRVRNAGELRLVATHGLIDMIKSLELKKEAQADLQLVIDILKHA